MRCSESGGLYVSLSGPADLKGKSIAVTRFGSLTHLALRPVLEKWKIGTQERCHSGHIGRLADIVPAIQQKRVAARMLSFPTLSSSGEVGLKTLYDLSKSDIEVPTTTVAVSRAYANVHPDRVSRFLRAYLEGTHRLMTDRGMGIRALRKYGGIHNDDLLAATYDLFTSKIHKEGANVDRQSGSKRFESDR